MATRRRWGVRGLVLGGALLGALALGAAPRIEGEVEDLAAAVEASEGAHLRYRLPATLGGLRPSQTFLGFFPGHGYALTAYVGADARFAPAQFLIVSRVDGAIRSELILPPLGPGHPSRGQDLRGPQAEAYLRRAGLSLEPIERVYRTYYAVWTR